ncbi:hypothetical protein A0J61_06378 [Choanephora cucurbitarum]|uniref:Uncharacterized protein n=1 Tax=Choanephora cucurbitarum TaxID=101091 RepID=A0A1C7N9F3_9FUNG|nr:hypothetical protein A0J61_06378 [Choanephora cucurbitarum]
MSTSLSSGILQNAVKKALTTNTPQESIHLTRVLQKMKPELAEYHDAIAPKRLLNVEKGHIAAHQNPAIVLDSLLHKTASQRSKGSLRYDDLIDYI